LKRVLLKNLKHFYKGCLICSRINATIFKRDTSLKELSKPKNEDADHEENNESGEEDPIKIQKEINGLKTGQNILIKIKSIQYEQNNLFIVASFVKCLE